MIRLTILMSLFLVACVGMGENVVVFRGEVVDPEGGISKPMSCFLSLQKDGVELMSYDISKQFFVDYVIEPRPRTYEVKIICRNGAHQWLFTSGPMSLGSDSDTVIDFGEITLEKFE